MTTRPGNKKVFDQLHEQCISTVKKLKSRNDQINKHTGIDSEPALVAEIRRDKEFFESEILKLKNTINHIEETYLDPDSVRKIEALKKQATKQIARNEYLMKELISNTFDTIQHSHETHFNTNHNNSTASNSRIHYEPPTQPQTPAKSDKVETFNPYHKQNQNQYRVNALQIQEEEPQLVDYELESSISKEKNKMLKDFEHNMVQINNIIKETAEMTYQQGEHIDIIGDQIFRTYKYTQDARENIQQANQTQKKARTKYILFGLLVTVIVAIIVGFFLMT